MPARTQMIVAASALLLSISAEAKQLWSTFSLTYLYGEHYELGADTREVLTVEHASTHNWGDNFFFLDHTTADDNTISNYFELSPRLSLNYLSGTDLSTGIAKDFYLASTLEGGNFNNYLLGLGTKLDVPGFQFVNINLYHVNNDLWDDDQQITINWAAPFSIGRGVFLYDGFIDYSTASDTNAKEMNFTSQLKWDIASLLSAESPFYLGIEYAYWINKYGVDGVDENNANLLLKWHF